MPDNYTEIVNKLKEEILSFEVDEIFVMGSDFMRFRFKTDNNLVYNTKINIPVCVISLSCKIVCMKIDLRVEIKRLRGS